MSNKKEEELKGISKEELKADHYTALKIKNAYELQITQTRQQGQQLQQKLILLNQEYEKNLGIISYIEKRLNGKKKEENGTSKSKQTN